MSLLTSADYDAVRAALDTSLTADMLPDDTIDLDIYAGRAELDVLARDPDAEGRTGNDGTRVKNAAIFFCAARLAPAVPHLVSARDDHVSWQRESVDWTARARDLRQKADENLNEVLDAGEVVRPTIFARAKGRRGK